MFEIGDLIIHQLDNSVGMIIKIIDDGVIIKCPTKQMADRFFYGTIFSDFGRNRMEVFYYKNKLKSYLNQNLLRHQKIKS